MKHSQVMIRGTSRTYKVLTYRKIKYCEGSIDEKHVAIVHVKASLGSKPKHIRQDINQWFHNSCDCSYDCCGHWFSSYIHTFRVSLREWIIKVEYQRNV